MAGQLGGRDQSAQYVRVAHGRNGLCPRETGPEAMENHPRFFGAGLRYAQIAVG